MKNLNLFFALCLMLFVSSGIVFADDFFSVASGDWNTGTTWDLGIVPTAADNVTIVSGHAITMVAAGTCASLTMEAGSSLALNAAALTFPGTSWALDPTSTVYYNSTTTVLAGPTYGNLVYAAANGGPAANTTLNIAGNLNITGVTLRGISATAGTNTINVTGDVILSGTGSRITAVNSTPATTASCTWNIGGSVKLTGNNAGNRLICYESAGPHSGSAVFNINGNLEIGTASQIQHKSSSPTTGNFSEGIINLKGNLVHGGVIGSNAVTSGTSPGLTINFVGTSQQDWSGSGTLSFSVFPGTFNVNNPSGLKLSSNRVIGAATGGSIILKMSQGALTLNSATLSYAATGILNYAGSSVQTTTDAEFPLSSGPANLLINNNAGVVLHASRTLNGALTLTNGRLTLGSNNLTLGTSATVGGGSTTSYIDVSGSGVFKRGLAADGAYAFPIGNAGYSPVTLTFAGAAYSSASIDVDVVNTKHPQNTSPTDYLNRYWTVTQTGISGFTCNANFVYADGDVAGTEANITLGKWDGGPTWYGYGYGNPTTNTLSGTGITSFSDFTGGEASALPIQLASFVGSYVGNSAKLEWSTISEVNNYGFNVQRLNGVSKTYENAGFVAGKGTTLESQTYTFVDNDAKGSVEYRLEQVDNNGLKNYFGPIFLNPNSVDNNSVPVVFALNQNYPNPFNPTTNITFSLANSGQTTLKVYNILGNEVATLFNGNAEAGKLYNVKFDATKLSTGMYMYKLQNGNSVEVKKLTLVK
jgi:hypothetical protein